ncbi:hypothetical protein [Bacillus safensis]|uniref:hypothetical protein n=1 Tax=Bacillus safensis TaxID=561879 RepID=UPI000B4513B9|nr:hypothetical protein [Bacillus safensis]UDB47311.1 hypothetical protein B0X07_18375 [Bacillus safensis]
MSVEFVRRDIIDSFIVPLTIRVANHFSEKRSSQISFVKLLRTRWKDLDVFKKRIEKEFSPFEDGAEIISIFEEAISGCTDVDTTNKVRGALAEGVLLGIYGNPIMKAKSFGWGSNVNLLSENKQHTHKVRYRCPKQCDINSPNCYNRETIDLGIWDGSYGEFFECKTRPSSVGWPEINYLKELNKNLNKKKIKHKIYFATTSTVDQTKLELSRKFPCEDFFEIVSLQESIA